MGILKDIFLSFFELRYPWIVGGILTSILWITLVYFFHKKARKISSPEHLQGAQIVDPKNFVRSIKEKGKIKIGPLVVPASLEVRHFLLFGKPGTGKTTILNQVISSLKKNDKSIIYDFKGDFIERFYDPKKDHIFNPLDRRSIKWNIFNEIFHRSDITSISHSLIPPQLRTQDPYWNNAARDVFSSILHYLYLNDKKTNRDIWEACTAEPEAIKKMCSYSEHTKRGLRYIEDASSRHALSVLSTMHQFVNAFEYMIQMDGDFSISKWIEEGEGKIFISSYPDIKDLLRPILSMFIDILSRKLLSLQDSLNRRIYIFLDEFGSLQFLPSIVDLLTRGRSKGASVWIGIQDLGQISRVYGENYRQSILNSCGNAFIFSVSDPTTAKYLVQRIGQRKILEPEESYSMGVEDFRDGLSISKRVKIENLLLDSDFYTLPDLTAYVQFAGIDGITRMKFPYISYLPRNPRMVMVTENILEEQKKRIQRQKEKEREIKKEMIKQKEKEQEHELIR